MNDRAKAILDFWFDDMVVEKRFKRDDNFDQLIRDKFKDDHEKAALNEKYRQKIRNLKNPFGDNTAPKKVRKAIESVDLNDKKWYVKQNLC